MRRQDDIEEVIVRSMRKGFTWFSNIVIDDYTEILGVAVLAVYTVLCRRAMGDRQKTKLAQDVMAGHLKLSKSTVSEAIVLLEWCDLIKVVRRHRSISTVYLRDVRSITPEVIAEIRERATKSQKYSKLRKTLFDRLDSFQSLGDRIDDFVAKSEDSKIKIVVAPDADPASNGSEPPAKSQNPELQKQWAEVLGQLQESMEQATFEGWLRETELASIEGNMWTVACPSSFVKDWLENRLVKNISQAVRSVADSDVELKFVVREVVNKAI